MTGLHEEGSMVKGFSLCQDFKGYYAQCWPGFLLAADRSGEPGEFSSRSLPLTEYGQPLGSIRCGGVAYLWLLPLDGMDLAIPDPRQLCVHITADGSWWVEDPEDRACTKREPAYAKPVTVCPGPRDPWPTPDESRTVTFYCALHPDQSLGTMAHFPASDAVVKVYTNPCPICLMGKASGANPPFPSQSFPCPNCIGYGTFTNPVTHTSCQCTTCSGRGILWRSAR